MTLFKLTGRRVAAFAVAWCLGLPALLLARFAWVILGDGGASSGHGVDLTKLYTLPILLVWVGPPLLLLVLWERSRRDPDAGSAAG